MNPMIFASVLLLAASAMAQYRPFYAGSGLVYPRPISTGGDDLNNRGSFDEPSRIDAYGHDTKLIEDANKYPENRKPFWLLNRDQIATHIGLNPQRVPAQRTDADAGTAAAAPQPPSAPAVDVVQPLESAADPASNVA